jgi:hypothetical protein
MNVEPQSPVDYPFITIKKNGLQAIDRLALVSWFNRNEREKIANDIIITNKTTRLYNGKLWKVYNEADLRSYIFQSFQDKGIDLLSGHVNELIKQVRDKPFKKEVVTTNYRHRFVISFLNGSLEIFPERKRYVFHQGAWNKQDFCRFQIQADYEEWLITEDRWIENQIGAYFGEFYKPECIDIIQMYLASVFIPYQIEKVMLILGRGGSGKSTLTAATTKLFDEDSVSYLEIADWGKTHQNLSLVNSLLNISNETSLMRINPRVFKSVVAGDPQTFNPKFSSPFDAKIEARHIITINDFPKQIFDGAMKRRYILLQTIKNIPEQQQNPRYKEDFINNRIYLLNFMLRGINKLIDNDYQINYQDLDLLYQLRIESDYLVQFVEEKLTYAEGEKTKVADIHSEYDRWRQYKSYTKPLSPTALMKRIYRILNTDEKYQGYYTKMFTQDRVMGVFNIKLPERMRFSPIDTRDEALEAVLAGLGAE